jgi:hypothetical protein
MTRNRSSNVLPTLEELEEQAGDWRLIAILLEPPRPGWRRKLRDASKNTVDPELRTAARLAQREGQQHVHASLFGSDGLLRCRESAHRPRHDRQPMMADLHGMAKAYGFDGFGENPTDHIITLAPFMAHLMEAQLEARTRGDTGEAIYLAGAADWLRGAHLAWFAEDLARALTATEVNYLSHVGYALEIRVLPPGQPNEARGRPSDDAVAEKLKKIRG